jgi:hypothetical protein
VRLIARFTKKVMNGIPFITFFAELLAGCFTGRSAGAKQFGVARSPSVLRTIEPGGRLAKTENGSLVHPPFLFFAPTCKGSLTFSHNPRFREFSAAVASGEQVRQTGQENNRAMPTKARAEPRTDRRLRDSPRSRAIGTMNSWLVLVRVWETPTALYLRESCWSQMPR